MSSQHPLDMYKVPRELVDVEAIAQELTRYLKITAEDTQYLSYHATERDRLIAELYKHPDLKPSVAPSQFVQVGQDPSVHLIPVNAEIDRLTPPKTLEERVARLHYAAAALMVFNQFKIVYGIAHHHDLEMQVVRRKREIMDEFYDGEFVRMFPQLEQRASDSPATTTQARLQVPTPGPSTHHSGVPKLVSSDEVEQFMHNPSTLVGIQFVHSPPHGEGEDEGEGDSGAWEVASCTVRKGDKGVEHDYHVLLAAFGGDPLPMDEAEVRYLLQYSTFAT
ncbi:hypothetical protein GSI_14228 [Ganoderma sinense ZZ0214-1]|uniref:Uncharacterized protein n=1 Tax=Ganoderma sinense ZZ0214-1 TaxID=1077348 RepID=A0A2G8RSK2_9APHY|nr:hypothetical protein GSI_14228 [Ganoderma sinense ZZ0214-1]